MYLSCTSIKLREINVVIFLVQSFSQHDNLDLFIYFSVTVKQRDGSLSRADLWKFLNMSLINHS